MVDAFSHSTPHRGRDLTEGSIPRHLILFSLPMLIGTALQTAYSFINAIWVGKFLGTAALAAVTVSFPIVFALIALCAGLTLATNILISQYYGAKNLIDVRKVVQNSTLLISAIAILLCGIGEVFTPAMLRAMNTPEDVFPVAVSYMRVFLLSLLPTFGHFLIRNMLQGIGDSKTPLYFQAGSVLFTTVFDPILMFGWLGFPALGLNGTAWATNISATLSLIAIVIYLKRKQSPVAPQWTGFTVDWNTLRATIEIGIPSALQQSLVSISMVFITGIVNSFGESAIAAFGAAARIDQIAFLPALTFSMAIASLAGQNIGAKKFDRIKEVYRWGLILSGGITLVCSALALLFPEVLLRAFLNHPSEISIGTTYLHIVASGYLFFAVMFVSHGIINGSGHTFIPTLITILSLWIVRVPLAVFLSRHLTHIRGVWIAIVVSFFVSMAASTWYYFSGKWKTPVIRRSAPAPIEPFGEETGEA